MSSFPKIKPICGIYKITSPSGNIYIGQSVNIRNRFNEYKTLRNCKSQRALYNSLLKYGSNAHEFEIIHSFDSDASQDHLNYHEIFYIRLAQLDGLTLLNIKTGGSNGRLPAEIVKNIADKNRGRKMSLEFRQKMSAIRKGKKIGPMSEEHKEKIRIGNLGKFVSDETKRKISNGNKGRKRSTEELENFKKSRAGYRHSEETKRKMSVAKRGKKFTDEHRENIRTGHTGKKMSEEACLKMSNSRIGWKRPPFSEESKMKMRLAKLGKPQSEQHKRNRAMAYSNSHKRSISL